MMPMMNTNTEVEVRFVKLRASTDGSTPNAHRGMSIRIITMNNASDTRRRFRRNRRIRLSWGMSRTKA